MYILVALAFNLLVSLLPSLKDGNSLIRMMPKIKRCRHRFAQSIIYSELTIFVDDISVEDGDY